MSKTLLIVLVASGAFVLVVGGGTAFLVSRLVLAPGPTADAPPSAEVEDIAELRERINRLEEEVRTLQIAPPMAEAPVQPVAAAETTGESAAQLPAASSEAIREQVVEEVKKTQAQQREAMGKRFNQMFKQRESGALDKMVSEHGMSSYQRDEMEKILERRRAAIGDFFRKMFSPEEGETFDMAKVREKMTEVQAESDKEIQSLLTPQQYDSWQTVQPRGGPGGGGGFMRGGGGGGSRQGR